MGDPAITQAADGTVTIIGADEVLLMMRIVLWKTPVPKAKSEAWAYSPDNPDFKTPGGFTPNPAQADSSVAPGGIRGSPRGCN